MSQKMTIDSIDLCSLLGLSHLEPLEKEKIIKSINEIVWAKFLLEELHKLLSPDDLEKLNQLITQKATPLQLLEYIEKKHRNIKKVLFAYTNEYKADFVKEYLQNRYTELNGLHKKATEPKILHLIQAQIEHYKKAIELADKKQWQELVLHMRNGLSK